MNTKIYKELNEKNDFFIHNVIQNNFYKDEDYLAVAQAIYKERDLDSDIKQEMLMNFSTYLFEADKMIKAGNSQEDVTQFLVSKNISEDQARTIAEAKFGASDKIKEINKSSKSNWAWYIFLTIVIIRWTVKLLQAN